MASDSELMWIRPDVAEAIAAAGLFLVREGQAVVDGQVLDIVEEGAGPFVCSLTYTS